MHKLIKLFISFCMLFGVCACSDNGLNKEYVGRYQLVKMTNGDTTYSQDIVQQAGFDFYIELKKDGSTIYKIDQEEKKGTWTNETIAIDGDPIAFEYKDGSIILTEDEYSMTFKK